MYGYYTEWKVWNSSLTDMKGKADLVIIGETRIRFRIPFIITPANLVAPTFTTNHAQTTAILYPVGCFLANELCILVKVEHCEIICNERLFAAFNLASRIPGIPALAAGT